MRCILKNGTEIDIPDSAIAIGEHTGMAGVAGNTITESDVMRVDEAAQNLMFDKGTFPIQWRRLYFELADGTQLEWPVGRQSRQLYAVWELTTADLTGLKMA